ncbi:MAG TPA: collagen-binding domain-containing protein [Verrucomicrobiae bacterium]|nr:collagen-binding domain-containing protein [Verrucomicrobiae bacterium]
MKIKLSPSNQGSALLLSLLIAVILLIALTSYPALVSDENQAVGRAQSWNAPMPMAEAGIEEALTQLKYAGNGTNLATNGWTLESDGLYHKSRTLSSAGYYAVAIQPATHPVIWSTGYVSTPISGGYISRLVKVQALPGPSFGKGVTAKGTISFTGNAYMDSYNVTNGVYDTGDPASTGVVLTDTNVAGAISLSGSPSCHITGTVDTGAGSGTIITGANNPVGSSNFVASGGSGASPNVQSGYYNNNANYQFNDVAVPSFSSYYTSFTTLGSSNIAGVSGQTTYYEVSSISQSLTVYGNVTIYVTGSISLAGLSDIEIATNRTLTLYVAGSVSIAGNGVVNDTGLAKALTVYGLPTCTSFSYHGNANFVGVIDAPEANFSLTGNAAAIGAFVVNSFSAVGNGGVHWDTSLASTGAFLTSNWNEVSLNQ